MDIRTADYKTITDRLQVGTFRKVPHLECSQSNVLRIENTLEGFKYYCFKCQEYAFSSNFNSPAERLRRLEVLRDQTKRQADKDYSLPADFSRTISPGGLYWLGLGGWTIAMIQKYNIGFSAVLNRVILPVVYDSIHRGYTARAVESWQSPKYLELCQHGIMWESESLRENYSADNKACYGSSDSLTHRNECVLTEDILSAGRCGEWLKSYSMLGTTLATDQLMILMNYNKIFIWLDNDKGGNTGLLKAVPRLRMFSDVQIVRSLVDPKLLTNKQIQEYLIWKK